MITIGVDAHKRVDVALALDDAGRELSEWRGPNSELGWRRLEQWASALGAERRVGIEGAWGYGRGLAQHLIAAGETVHEVNPRWTADGRRSARKPDKTDRQDARAVALFVQREASNLPTISAEDETALLDLLATEREAAVVESTRLRNRLHALLSQLDPEYHLHMPPMVTKAGRAALRAYEASDDRSISLERAASMRRLAERLELVVSQAEAIARRIRELAKQTLRSAHRAPWREPAHGGDHRWHPRPWPALQQRCRPRGLRRRLPARGLLRRPRAPSTQPGRQPTVERDPLPHRPHAGTLLAPWPCLHRAPTTGGQVLARGCSRAETSPRPRAMAAVADRRPTGSQNWRQPRALEHRSVSLLTPCRSRSTASRSQCLHGQPCGELRPECAAGECYPYQY